MRGKGKKLPAHKLRNPLLLAVPLVLFAAIGSILLFSSHAATPVNNAFEPESGTVTASATVGTDTNASNSKYVSFNANATTPPPPTPPPTVPPSPPGTYKPLPTKTAGWAWQWQLTGTVNETVLDNVSNPNKMYDIDMFSANAALVSRLKAKGIYVVCYIESGDWSGDRPDANDFDPAILSSNKLEGFNEKYINVGALDAAASSGHKTLRQIMTARFQMAKDKGCDGIEPDLDDLHTYSIQPFKITQAQQVAYNSFMIQMGHSMGMSVGLKNGPDDTSAGSFTTQMFNAGADWALNEECNQFSECAGYSTFIKGGRAVFQVEYLDDQKVAWSKTCASDNAAGFDGIVKDSSSSLSALPRTPCRTGN